MTKALVRVNDESPRQGKVIVHLSKVYMDGQPLREVPPIKNLSADAISSPHDGVLTIEGQPGTARPVEINFRGNQEAAMNFYYAFQGAIPKKAARPLAQQTPQRDEAAESLDVIPPGAEGGANAQRRKRQSAFTADDDGFTLTNRNCLQPSSSAYARSSEAHATGSTNQDTTPKPNYLRGSAASAALSDMTSRPLSAPTSPPANTSSRIGERTESKLEALKRKFPEAGIDHTPEKAARHWRDTRNQPAPTRAPAPQRQALKSDAPWRPVSPQRSSQYRGYRFQETFGLRNLGNTCYLNAVMQALHGLTAFEQELKRLPERVPTASEGELFRCTTEILSQMSSQKTMSGPLSPAKLRERIASISPAFGSNSQQDAHEFFLEYMNQLHDELVVARESFLASAGAERPQEELLLTTQQFFDSKVHRSLVCKECGHTNQVEELFRDFSLDVLGASGAGSSKLQDMISGYFAPEDLELKCEQCPCKAARMESSLASQPRALVLHLKRFVPNFAEGRYEKFHQQVDFPVLLDLNACLPGAVSSGAKASTISSIQPSAEALKSICTQDGRLPARPLVSEEMRPDDSASVRPHKPPPLPPPLEAPEEEAHPTARLYDLRAIVAHEGSSPHAGHYVCYVKRDSGPGWTCYNDAFVDEMPDMLDPQQKLGRKAYMLFYVQR
eukprot:CAMPEP_0178416712 /NCGR_PEP_ID=MMETSP0689_2-20121128/24203_1 /TAXON_ID=160604 /ORGANISM="Amphidinium massartii, Strain CS-259" /LENGTH=670 /DNA_ID=CAMNT_0020038061 /DNA_START=22 /DNA_END=2034 /DNA_ORIENTATION=+